MTPIYSSPSFERHVVDSLARLETNMETLVGQPGKPGRIDILETKVFRLILAGVAVLVLILGPTAIHLLF